MARVLVIEDNDDNLELMRYLLQAFSHSVLTAEDGEAGIAAALRDKPDLILCDIHLPGADGYAVVQELRRRDGFGPVPIIAVTALAMLGDREKILAAGFDGYVSKPIEPQTFVAEVDRYLNAELRGAAPQVSATESPQQRAVEANLATILVVDDSDTNRELIYSTLAPFGYRVRTTQNVAEALGSARASIPDLVLSDLHMPGNDGFTLIRGMRASPELAHVPVILISSSVWGARDRDMALELGAARFLLRPIEPKRLIEEIAACLAIHGAGADGHDPGR